MEDKQFVTGFGLMDKILSNWNSVGLKLSKKIFRIVRRIRIEVL